MMHFGNKGGATGRGDLLEVASSTANCDMDVGAVTELTVAPHGIGPR